MFFFLIIEGTLESPVTTETAADDDPSDNDDLSYYMRFKLLDARLWAASEIIFHGGKFFYELLTENPNQADGRRSPLHALASDISPLSLGRWEFWKKRFIEFTALAETYQIDSSIVARLTDTIKHMDAIQQEGT
jgi:hypothetical protein